MNVRALLVVYSSVFLEDRKVKYVLLLSTPRSVSKGLERLPVEYARYQPSTLEPPVQPSRGSYYT